MRKRGRILLAALLLAVLGLAWWQIFGEPRYHWRSLSSWLREYGNGPKDYKPSPQADDALRHIGPKAVPYLLRMLRSTNDSYSTRFARKTPPPQNPSPNIIRVLTLRGQQEKPVAPPKPWMKFVEKYTPFRVERTVFPASWNHWKVYLAFQALGTNGRAALPELAKLAYRNPDENSNPSGTGMAPNVAFWTNTDMIAIMAGNSTNYLGGQYFTQGGLRGNSPILVDGEIAAWSLAAVGADSVPPLLEMLENPNPRLRGRAVTALGLIGPPAEPAVPALVKKIKDPNSDVQWQSVDTLGCIGRKPDLVVPALTQALRDRNVAMKFSAMTSLGKFREQATNAIPTLLTLLSDPDNRVGPAAAVAISKISNETTKKEVLPTLLAKLKDSQGPFLEYPRYNLLDTLGQMTNQPDAVIPVLTEALNDTSPLVRNTAIHRLGDFGPAAKPAVPKLALFTTNPDTNVVKLALTSLEKIDPEWRSRH